MDFINKLKSDATEVEKLFRETWADLEGAFENLKKAGKNSVDGIVQWMKNSKLISTKEHEKKARELFDKAANKKDVTVKEFKEVATKMVEDRKKDFEELGTKVKEEGNKLVSAFKAGTSAMQGTQGSDKEKKDEKKS